MTNFSRATSVILVGPPGSGKTSSGQLLAKRLGWSFADTDRLIEQRQGASVSELFAASGEQKFRQLETELLQSLADKRGEPVVIATGGGIIITPGNFELMEKIGIVVGLMAGWQTLATRLQSDQTRPLLVTGQAPDETVTAQKALESKLKGLLRARSTAYAQPSMSVQTDGLTSDEVADAIYELMANQR